MPSKSLPRTLSKSGPHSRKIDIVKLQFESKAYGLRSKRDFVWTAELRKVGKVGMIQVSGPSRQVQYDPETIAQPMVPANIVLCASHLPLD